MVGKREEGRRPHSAANKGGVLADSSTRPHPRDRAMASHTASQECEVGPTSARFVCWRRARLRNVQATPRVPPHQGAAPTGTGGVPHSLARLPMPSGIRTDAAARRNETNPGMPIEQCRACNDEWPSWSRESLRAATPRSRWPTSAAWTVEPKPVAALKVVLHRAGSPG